MNRTTKPILLTLILFAGLLNSCNANGKKTEETTMPEQNQTQATPAYKEDPNWKNEPGLYAEFNTAKGTIVCKLFYDKAPMTVGNFVALCEGKQTNTGKPVGQPFYDGIAFHRVIANFMIQGGDAAGNGTGSMTTYKFPDEIDPSLVFDGPGILAMANAGPNTNQTQFFITHVATPWLNGKHTIFGKVMVGQTIVNAIAQGDLMNTVKIVRVGKDAEAFDGLKTYNEKLAEISKKQAEQAKMNDMSPEEFVKKYYPKAKKTASGLYYVVEQPGTGAQAVAGKSVSVHYTGTFADGKKFDSSRDRGQPITFTLGQGQVIKGWDEGIALMSVGAKYKLIIPYQLAYGEGGRPPQIPAKSMLIFDTELVDVK